MSVKGVAGRPATPSLQPDSRKIPKYRATPMITNDGYAAVPWYGTKYVILYNGEQIADVDSEADAVAYIRNQQKITKPKKAPSTPAKTPRKSRESKSKGRLTLGD